MNDFYSTMAGKCGRSGSGFKKLYHAYYDYSCNASQFKALYFYALYKLLTARRLTVSGKLRAQIVREWCEEVNSRYRYPLSLCDFEPLLSGIKQVQYFHP